jgi:hypothetical protein
MQRMSTLQIDLTRHATDLGPPCARCGSPTRLVGIEPHPTKAHTDLRTFECTACQALKAHVVPLAS